MNTVFLGLGSNLGNKEDNILKAYDLISSEIGSIQCKSSFYYSEAVGFKSHNGFVNSVIQVKTIFKPFPLLNQLKKIEIDIGRKKKSIDQVYNDRIIDIDILFFNDAILKKENLQIPHPYVNERLFVLVPLKEIAADFIHPELSKKVSDLLFSIKDE